MGELRGAALLMAALVEWWLRILDTPQGVFLYLAIAWSSMVSTSAICRVGKGWQQ